MQSSLVGSYAHPSLKQNMSLVINPSQGQAVTDDGKTTDSRLINCNYTYCELIICV